MAFACVEVVKPNGDVLVAETNGPPRPEDTTGIRGWMMKRTMARAGAARSSANRITLLRDLDRDGIEKLVKIEKKEAAVA